MNEITPLLENLAEQLGTTVEYLWPLMVKQTQIDWVSGTVASLVLAVLCGLLCYRILGSDPGLDSDRTTIELVPVCVVGTIATIALFCRLARISTLIIPEAATVQRLLEMVGK